MWVKRQFVSRDIQTWVERSFAYDIDSTNLSTWREYARLILPTRTFFDVPAGQDKATAEAICARIQTHLRHTDRRFELEPIARMNAEYRHEYGQTREIAGTYHYDETTPVIHYDPEEMRQPLSFINTMAHEVMHDVLYPIAADLPGGLEGHELATDLFCIIRGFGIFQLRAADDVGWSGYLSQQTRAWALGRYLALAQMGPDSALNHLTGRPAKLLKQALAAQAKAGFRDEITIIP